jgi:hypothetical protein
LVGRSSEIGQALEALRLTLVGPSREQLQAWGTDAQVREEWFNAQTFFALKDANGGVIPVEDFFEILLLDDGPQDVYGTHIERVDWGQFKSSANGGSMDGDLADDVLVGPRYPRRRFKCPVIRLH